MNKKKEKKVKISFDLISKEMAELIVNERKEQIEKNLVKEIIHYEKSKKKELPKDNKYLINNISDSSESDDSTGKKKLKLERSKSKKDLINFQPKNNKINGDKNMNKNHNLFNSNNKNNSTVDHSINDNSKHNLAKRKKDEIEVKNFPLYRDKKKEKNKLNYYNIIYYIENTKRQEEKEVNSQKIKNIRKANSLFNKEIKSKSGIFLKEKGKFKNSTKDKKEYSFLYEDQQNNVSENFGNYLDFSNSKRLSDNALLYSNSKNSIFNKSQQDDNIFEDFDEFTTNEHNSLKKGNIIFNNYQGKKSFANNFFQKQIYRQRLKEIKINRQKKMIDYLENKSFSYFPKINKLSSEIIKRKGNYIPLFQRALDIENQKRNRILIKQKMLNKSFSANTSHMKKKTQKDINEFFNTQINWKKKVEKENNILKKKLKEKEEQEIIELKSYFRPNKSRINKSKMQQKSYSTIYDNDMSKNSIYSNYLKINDKRNFGNRLYKDYEKRQKNLIKLKKKLTPSFTPMINKSNDSSKINSFIINKINVIKPNDQKSTSLILEYNSSFIDKQQKSRNPKNNKNKKPNNNSLSNPANQREINNNLKSTAVDSKNTKSHLSFDILCAKLTQIKEFKDNDEEFSSSNISLHHILNKNTIHKMYISNKKNKSSNFKYYQDSINKSKFKSHSFIYNISEDRIESKIENLTNKSKSNKINSINENTKNIQEQNDDSKISLKEYYSGKLNLNLNLDDIKQLIDLEQNNPNKENQTPTLGKNISNKSNKNLKSHFQNQNIQIKEKKELKDDDKDKINSKIIDKVKDVLDKNKKVNEEKNIDKIFDNNKNRQNNVNITKTNNRSKNKKDTFKRFSAEEFFKNPQNLDDIDLNKKAKKTKSIFLYNKINSSSSNQNKECQNPFKNQNDSIDINNQINLENKDSKYLNDFLINDFSSQISYQYSKLINNSSYILKEKMFESKNNFGSKIKKESKRKTFNNYKLNELKDDEFEEEEDNEETENKGDTNNNTDKDKDESFSWIKKLDEIAKNEETKEIGSFNKKKVGNSSTRPQTKRNKGNSNNNEDSNKQFFENLDENKLYMLNLRNSSSTGSLNPFTIVAHEPIFYKFFLKNQKSIQEN